MQQGQGYLNGSPIREPQAGEEAVLLFDKLDPPTMSHVRAIEALYAKWQSPILVCPLSGARDESVRAMCSILCVDLCASKTQAWMCSVGLDRKISDPKEILEWLTVRKKGIVFVPACIWPDQLKTGGKFAQVILGKGGQPSEFAIPLIVGWQLAIPDKIEERIRSGIDESRNIPAPVWAYIQKKKLYRI